MSKTQGSIIFLVFVRKTQGFFNILGHRSVVLNKDLAQLFPGRLKLDNSIGLVAVIQWVMNFPLNSIIQPLNN